MTNPRRRNALAAAAAIIAAAGLAPALLAGAAPAAAPPVSFKEQVLPIFQLHCVACHSPGGVGYTAIGLDLRSYQGLRAGSSLSVAVVPGHPELSPLIAVLQPNGHSFKNLKMPPLGPLLSPQQIDIISRWIQEGANDN